MHPSKPHEFICDLCGKVYNRLHNMRGHMNRVHRLKADGSPWEGTPSYSWPKKAMDSEDYGLTTKKGKRGKNYLRVGDKLKCNFCDRRKPVLMTTIKTKRVIELLLINYLFAVYTSADGLYKHELEKHPTNPGEFICTHFFYA